MACRAGRTGYMGVVLFRPHTAAPPAFEHNRGRRRHSRPQLPRQPPAAQPFWIRPHCVVGARMVVRLPHVSVLLLPSLRADGPAGPCLAIQRGSQVGHHHRYADPSAMCVHLRKGPAIAPTGPTAGRHRDHPVPFRSQSHDVGSKRVQHAGRHDFEQPELLPHAPGHRVCGSRCRRWPRTAAHVRRWKAMPTNAVPANTTSHLANVVVKR